VVAVSKLAQLDLLKEEILKSDVCSELASSATQLVMGAGNPDADIMFIGEAPGAEEDKQGLPFVGRAGQFLNDMLQLIHLQREDVYITNIVKYRPPNNRDPQDDEKSEFLPYLFKQIAIIQPRLIVTLGRHSMNAFLPGFRISEVHGQPKRKTGIVYLPLYHPAAALYNGSMKQTLVDDFMKIPKILEKIKKGKNEQRTI
jgi:DNA polymerase